MTTPATVGLAQEVAEHLLGHLEVRDHAVPQRAHRRDRRRRPADHLLGRPADRMHLAADRVEGDHRRLRQHDAKPANEDQRVRGPEIDRDVAPREPESTRRRPPRS
jgi:hypothetical protein